MTLELVNWMFFYENRSIFVFQFRLLTPQKYTSAGSLCSLLRHICIPKRLAMNFCSVCVWLFLAISSDFRARIGLNIFKKDYEETYALCACSLYASAYHARICERNDLSVSTCAAGKTNGLSKQYFIVAAVAVVLYSSSKSLHIDSFSDLHWNDV